MSVIPVAQHRSQIAPHRASISLHPSQLLIGKLLADAAYDPTVATVNQVRLAAELVLTDSDATQLLASYPINSTVDRASALADWLYRAWWCGPQSTAWTAAADSSSAAPVAAGGSPAHSGAARLEAARRSAAMASAGWLVLAAVGPELVAAQVPAAALGQQANSQPSASSRNPLTGPAPLLRTQGELVVASSRPGLPPRPGDLVTLLAGQSGLDQDQGWWWAHTGDPNQLLRTELDRWYFNVRNLSAAVALVPRLIEVANLAGCDLSLKCPPIAAGYGRRDALVCYLPRSQAGAAETVLLRQIAAVQNLLDPDVPPLTRLIVPGIGQAQDPGEPEPTSGPQISYGQLRCGQVAMVLAQFQHRWLKPAGVSDQDLVGALRRVGIDPANPQRVQS